MSLFESGMRFNKLVSQSVSQSCVSASVTDFYGSTHCRFCILIAAGAEGEEDLERLEGGVRSTTDDSTDRAGQAAGLGAAAASRAASRASDLSGSQYGDYGGLVRSGDASDYDDIARKSLGLSGAGGKAGKKKKKKGI